MSILLQNTGQLVWGSEPIAYPKLFATNAYSIGPARVAPQLVWIIVLGILVMVSLQLFLAFTRTGRRAAGRVADRNGANLRPDRLMVGYAADTDRYTCMER